MHQEKAPQSAALPAESDPENRVLEPGARFSENLYADDRILQQLYARCLSPEAQAWMAPRWASLGQALATRMDALSLAADRHGPRHIPRDRWGRDIHQLEFHPAYTELTALAVHSGMFEVKWDPSLRRRFGAEGHRMGFSAGLLYAMGEAGLYCPLCMTDGVARILDRYGDADDRDRLLPLIATTDPAQLRTGAMFLTEKSGGSDVGSNRVRAVAQPDVDGPWYKLYGEKWFCSNAGAEIVLALARTEGAAPGTRGLSIFLIQPEGPAGQPNPRRILRLKDKLGVRSMASAEIVLEGTWGKRLGSEGQGFAIMAEMINLSRLYNAVTAVALARRGLREAWQFLRYRRLFGHPALEHALIRERLEHLASAWLGELLLCWRAMEALDRADAGDEAEARLARLLTPMTKRSSAEFAVYSLRECMELMGGMGYIEDGIMPKMLRDANVLPIWEGAGNIMLLDMLRATDKAGSAPVLWDTLRALLDGPDAPPSWRTRLEELVAGLEALQHTPRPSAEYRARPLWEAITQLVQAALILDWSREPAAASFCQPALSWYARRMESAQDWRAGEPLSSENLSDLIGFA
jgi:acyl-CoA dehydrogenase